MPNGVHIDYKALRAVNPETARLAVLEYLDSCGHDVAETACTFGLTRATVYYLERKRQTGTLADRSRVTNDQEFYIRRAFHLTSTQRLLEEATGYLYYNTLREHSSLGYRTPFQVLKTRLPQVDENIRLVIPILLDAVAVQLGPWSGYNLLAQHLLRSRAPRSSFLGPGTPGAGSYQAA